MSGAPAKLALKREVNLVGAVSLITGIMIGSGIFMSPQLVLQTMGSPGSSLVIWGLCGVLATFGSLCYMELSTIIKESGSEYTYILHTSGPVMAFLFVFTSLFFVGPASTAGIALSFASYIVAPFYEDCVPPELVVKCVAVAGIVVLTIVNGTNVRLSISIQVLFMAAKILSLGIIIIGGVVLLTGGKTSSLENSFEGTHLDVGAAVMAFYQGLWSYDGWNSLNYITEELKHPEVNLPRSLLIAIPLVTALYLLVNISYLAALTPRELMTSTAVAVTWGNKVLGSWGWLMSVAAALSAFGSMNGSCFTGGRLYFVAAREGHMPDILSMAHVHRLTPLPALAFKTVLALLVLIPGDFQSIISLFSFTSWFFYGITVTGLLYLKLKKPELRRTFTVPIVIPVLFVIAAGFLVVAPIIDNPKIEYLYVVLFVLSGIIFYIPFIHYKLHPGFLDKITTVLQLFLEVAPAEKNL
ncbi:b(0,+)-type amino acid transporter 1-like isoform X1 [Arapaima gigas]